MDWAVFVDMLQRVVAAAILGGLLGFERELNGSWAGLRTHMLVAMGAALFVIASWESSGGSAPELSRVMQGIAAGIGFLGAGTILQLGDPLQVRGLTTAGSIWLTAALGTAAGLKLYELAAAGALISIVILTTLRPVDRWFRKRRSAEADGG